MCNLSNTTRVPLSTFPLSLLDFEECINAKTLFSHKVGKEVWLKEKEYKSQRTKSTKNILERIEQNYQYFIDTMEIYKLELTLGRATKLQSHGKLSYVWDNDHSSNYIQREIHLKGVFLRGSEQLHPESQSEPENILINDFNLDKYDGSCSWILITRYEYESNHRTSSLPVGLYTFMTDANFDTLNLGHGPPPPKNPSVIKLEHATLPRYIISTAGHENDLRYEWKKIMEIKELSECHFELHSDNKSSDGTGRKNSYHDARLTKTNVGKQARQYLSWLSEHGRDEEHFKKLLKAKNKNVLLKELDHAWTYLEDKHGIIVRGDFAMENERHELTKYWTPDYERIVTSSRTEFHLNFSIDTIPNWNDEVQGKGKWRFFEYDFDIDEKLYKSN